jgi:hypothetical protein
MNGHAVRKLHSVLTMLRTWWQSRSLRYDLGNQDPERFLFPFAARLIVRLKDGRSYEVEQKIPLGAPGNVQGDQRRLAEEKFAREAKRVLTSNQIQKAISRIQTLPHDGRVRELLCLIAKNKARSGKR